MCLSTATCLRSIVAAARKKEIEFRENTIKKLFEFPKIFNNHRKIEKNFTSKTKPAFMTQNYIRFNIILTKLLFTIADHTLERIFRTVFMADKMCL
jgi:hypothetical protein